MAAITVQSLTTAGRNTSYTAMSSADEFSNNGHTFIVVKNSVAATNTVVITSQVSPVPKGLIAIDCSVEVSASGERWSGFFDRDVYNDSSGNVHMRPTTHTGLTIAAISVT